MIFDTHSHCYFEVLAPNIDQIHDRMIDLGVTHSTQIGCDVASSIAAIELAKKYPNWYATVGYHPVDAQNPESSKNRAGGKEISPSETGVIELPETEVSSREKRENDLRLLVENNRDIVVAIGETGLDQHYLTKGNESKELSEQYYWFERLAQMGKDYSLPLVIHSRDARRETIEAIKKFNIRSCVIHCFSEDRAFAEELLEFSESIYFSFSGILTYKNAPEIQDAAKNIPLNRILVETDAPFLTPNPKRGEKNEPGFTKYVMDFLKTLRSEPESEIEQTVFENSLRFYQIR